MPLLRRNFVQPEQSFLERQILVNGLIIDLETQVMAGQPMVAK